ncbi:hypothetical protein TNCV_1304781 [Trichonephila clavipes]|nr:hypothetical protein TNCV_1304781 [Trichonephila clavipes]
MTYRFELLFSEILTQQRVQKEAELPKVRVWARDPEELRNSVGNDSSTDDSLDAHFRIETSFLHEFDYLTY